MELSARIWHALDALDSPELESRVRAVDEFAACSAAIVERVVAAFAADEDARAMIYERLVHFGSLMIGPLERVHHEARDEDVRQISAFALIYLGNSLGVPSLMDSIVIGNPNMCMAALSLSAAGVTEAAEPIKRAILECDLSDNKSLDCLTFALRRLEHPMPENIRQRLSEVEPN